MTPHATLFAIKILINSLNYPASYTEQIRLIINEMIENENDGCTDEYKKRLENLNKTIETEL